MSTERISVFLAESSILACQLLSDALRRLDESIEILACETDSRGFLCRLGESQPDVALISSSLCDGVMAGFKVLYEMRATCPVVRPIVVLDAPEKDLIVAAFRTGALGTYFEQIQSICCTRRFAACTQDKSGQTVARCATCWKRFRLRFPHAYSTLEARTCSANVNNSWSRWWQKG
jgi:DNA-binding NarL/FixJ family response regulator